MSWRTVTAQSCVPKGREQGDSTANNPLTQVQLCSGSTVPCLTHPHKVTAALLLSSSLTRALHPHCHSLCSQEGLQARTGAPGVLLQLWILTSALEQDVTHRRPSLGRGLQPEVSHEDLAPMKS